MDALLMQKMRNFQKETCMRSAMFLKKPIIKFLIDKLKAPEEECENEQI